MAQLEARLQEQVIFEPHREVRARAALHVYEKPRRRSRQRNSAFQAEAAKRSTRYIPEKRVLPSTGVKPTSTADVASALSARDVVSAAAVDGMSDETESNKVVPAPLMLPRGHRTTQQDPIRHVRSERGRTVTPAEVTFVEGRPKTRSGKPVRRLLKAQALGQAPGDASTLEMQTERRH